MPTTWCTKQNWQVIYLPVLLGVVIGGLSVWVWILIAQSSPIPQTAPTSNESVLVLEPAIPQGLRIPTAQIDTTFAEPLGLNTDGSIAVPDTYEQVGLYQHGPTPGEIGPAVILGHVDSYTGPAVFYNLRKLSVGDEIFIEREDGTTAVFTVTETETLDQKEFPTEKVYGDLTHAGLRLITCDGTFDQANQQYSHNFIAYAELARVE